jgi:hypothetical protein
MSDDQSSKKKQFNPRRIVLLGAGATVLAIINMATGNSEAQPLAVVILQDAALALGLLALVGGLIMMLTQK